MSLGGSSGSTNTVQQSDPWHVAQPYLAKLFTAGNELFEGNRGGLVAPKSPITGSAQTMQAARAVGGSPVVQGAQQNLQDTVQGKYLDPTKNPAWAPMTQRLGDAYRLNTAAPLDAKFAKGGNSFMDNSAYQEMRGNNERAFGDVLSGFAGNIYNQERERMMQGSALAPTLANQDYVDIGKLGEIGAQDEARMQAQMDAPWNQLQQFQRVVTGQPGGTVNSQQPYFTNDVANAMGLGMMGMSIYDMMS